MPLDLEPAIFRAVAATIVPESVSLDEPGWRDVEQVIEALLLDRPAAMKRQLRLFLRGIEWLPVIRYGRTFTRLDAAARTRVLAHLQNDRIQKVRVGFWGLRTIVLAGYYGRAGAAREIGYAATPRGWEARP
ncbi:MAG TPA: gluconate 2-dehydrogenase subunit 3 family protein [Bryobacteraceae bacterium]|nr:gluconate 2-dehydrogenase subunit 3 family protein [Bryobacteraceae bacterium]